MAQWVKNLPAIQKTQETGVQSLGQEDPLEKEMATHSLQVFLPENPMDRGVWWAIVHGVTKSQTQLEPLSRHRSKLVGIFKP